MATDSNASPPAKVVNDYHKNDDVDSGTRAHHHTLGNGTNQAMPGDALKDMTTPASSSTYSQAAMDSVIAMLKALGAN